MNSHLANLPQFPAFTWCSDVLNPILMNLRTKQVQLVEGMEALMPEFKAMAHAEMLKLDAIGHLKIAFPQLSNDNQQDINLLADSIQEIRSTLIGSPQKIITTGMLEEAYIRSGSLINSQDNNNQLVTAPLQLNGLDQFLTWFNKPGLDRLLKAAITHLWFAAIAHNSNQSGILARLLCEIQLTKADNTSLRYYSLNNQLSNEFIEYQFIVLQSLKGSLDITIWLQWFLGCLERAYDNSSILLEQILKKANYWSNQNHQQLNKRQETIINILLAGFNEKLTTTVYSQLTQCSRDTALRDVTYLLHKKVFIKKEGRGKNTEYLLNI